jgi:HEAT repeat protein
MRDLKTVLLLAVPLILVAGGIYALNAFFQGGEEGGGSGVLIGTGTGSRPDRPNPGIPNRPVRLEPTDQAEGDPLMNHAVPRIPRDGPEDGLVTVAMVVALLDIATGEDHAASDTAWRKLEELLKTGILIDPVQVQVLLVSALGKSGNNSIWAAKLIPMIRDESARERASIELLDLALESSDPQVLKAAFEALGIVGTGEAVETLARLARNQTLDGPAAAAIYAIARIGSEESAVELARILMERQGTGLEADIVKAIGQVKSPAMVAELMVHLTPETPTELRLLAVRALGLTRQPEAVAPLMTLLSQDGDMTMKGTALEALSRVGNAEAVAELIRLHAGKGELSFAAGLAIGNVEGKDAVKALLESYDSVEDSRVKVRWVEALGNSGSKEPVEKLRDILDSTDESSEVRGRAAISLARIGDTGSVGSIANVLSSARKDDVNLVIQLTDAVKKMIMKREAHAELVEKVLPVLQKMTATPSQDVVYMYANQARMALENVKISSGR